MNPNNLPLSQHIRDEIYLYWVTENFSYWVKEGLIPKALLEPSRVCDLYAFLLNNQTVLLRHLKEE